jgi:hypothetical protein
MAVVGFQDHPFQPLTHPSAAPFYSEILEFLSHRRFFQGFDADTAFHESDPAFLLEWQPLRRLRRIPSMRR